MLKSLLVVGTLAASAIPALADEYYIVRDNDGEDCRVVETRPTENTIVQVGPIAFATREEADRELTVLCKEEDSGDKVIIKRD
jgi:hypothetical protein